jgi:hypothetical protein
VTKTSVQPFNPEDLRENVFDSGWRLFAELWDTDDPLVLRKHATSFPNLTVMNGIPEYPDVVLAFEIDSLRFAVLRSQSEYLFLVENPNCDTDVLLAVARHFNSLLRPITSIILPG